MLVTILKPKIPGREHHWYYRHIGENIHVKVSGEKNMGIFYVEDDGCGIYIEDCILAEDISRGDKVTIRLDSGEVLKDFIISRIDWNTLDIIATRRGEVKGKIPWGYWSINRD